ncbi:restriction endonuclease subunit S [Algibacter sp. L4_22]|uniref:restriction endonuclease subunit S n=1 Tax=Algibacter sp. L4_22 TaxID=2942477 RepID=UPI00201B6966|nr:restriction endonuclease subunit S [Algibacter sp. L4_22]MCL5127304.1 restriction endonuclease subunit S [Algibacter sp. L4_22]
MKTYEAYKNSGIDWIGDMPQDWNVSQYKFVSEVQNGFAFKSNLFDKSEGFPILRIRDITSGRISTYYQGKFSDDYIVSEGDLLIGMDGDFNVRWWDKEDVLLNQRCCRIFNKSNADRRFLYYIIPINLQIINDLTYYTTVKHLSSGDINNAKFSLPSLKEQTQIANYLDHKTQIIDALIEKKELLIKKLQAQRQAIINEAVTKGLNPNAKMKDSGIEWLGGIPEHWEVVKFRYKFETTKGLTITKANLLDSGIPCVNYGEIHSKYGFEVNPEIHKLKYVSEDYLDTNENSLLYKGDFVFADTSEDIEGAGNFTHLNSDIPTFAGYHTIIARLIDNSNYRFVAYFLDSITYRTQIQNLVKGVKVYSITNKILKDTFLFFPPENEQDAIAQFIDNKVKKISSSIKILDESIKKLKAYRQSIISEAVTGKINVRDWQPQKLN